MTADTASASRSNLEALLRKGFAALSAGKIAVAAQACKEVLALKPDLVQGHFLTGLVALEARDRKTAFAAFSSVTHLQKDHAAAWAQLAKLFMSDGQVNRADAALADAIRSGTDDAIVQDLLGSVYSMMGEHGLARDWYQKAVAAQPTHPPFLLNLANNLIYHGETEDAEVLIRKIIDVQPNSPQAHWSLAGARRADDRTHIEQMQSQLERVTANPRAQAFYYYGIGKELEDLECWDDAFDAFEAGARARRRTVAYDERAEIEMFRSLEEHFTEDWLNDGASGHATDAPIFVLGQPRTGTTLVERIISSHSRVHSAGELQQFSLAIRRISRFTEPERFSSAFFAAALPLDPAAVGRLYMDSCARMRGSTPHFVDKLPQNYLLIPFILKALPNAKVVHLMREPMDACFASYKQLFADAYLHSYDQEEMARHHARYRRLMDVWRERFGQRFLDVAYEDTVRHLEPQVRRLLEFLELPWEESCLRFHEQDQAVSTASAVQVRQPVHTRSIGRWRRYANRLQSMHDTLQHEGVV